MKKAMAATSTLVIIILSLAIIISGVLLAKNISNVTAALPSPKAYFFTASVFPEKAQPGTVFTVKVDIGNANRSSIYRINAQILKDNGMVSEVPLFDDGMHGDGKADDGIYANTFDSAGKEEGVYAIDIAINPIENKETYKNAASFQIFRNSCESLRYSGNPSGKIDLVFLASGYSDMEKFKNDVIKFVDIPSRNKGLFALEPFKSNLDKFNIYFVNSQTDLECKLGCEGINSMACCNDHKVSETASQCPADQIAVLIDSSEFCGTASYYSKVCTISRGPEVFTHEWGHSFGGLGDEYDYSSYYPTYNPDAYDYPNCDKESCPKWSGLDLEGIGCYKGCGVSSAYRPTEKDCEMYYYVGKYDSVDVISMRKLLDRYNPLKLAELPAPSLETQPDKAYLVSINYNKGSLGLDNVYLTQTTAPDRKIARQVDYRARLISFDDHPIYNFNFEMSLVEYPGLNPNVAFDNQSKPSPIVLESVNRLLAVPYYPNAKKMEIYDLHDRKVLEVNLEQFGSLCGNKICEENENSLQCSDCAEAKSDNLCTYSEDGICDPDCKAVDPDCKKLTPLMIANMAAFVIFIFLLALVVMKNKE